MSCGVCYEDFKPFELISSGCCSFTMCRNCVQRVEKHKCPQCRTDFAWAKISKATPSVQHIPTPSEQHLIMIDMIESERERQRISNLILYDDIARLERIINSQKLRLLIKCKQVCELEAELKDFKDEHDSVSDMSDVVSRFGLVIHNQDFQFRPKIISDSTLNV